MGLPSGTLWLDRTVGAQSPSSPGLFFQWGSIIGHTISDGFAFDYLTYISERLNRITSDLSEAQDAARAFYGETARMPSASQLEELLEYCSSSITESGAFKLTSTINGRSIVLNASGYIYEGQIYAPNGLRAWTSSIEDEEYAKSLHGDNIGSVSRNFRQQGLNVLAVHS